MLIAVTGFGVESHHERTAGVLGQGEATPCIDRWHTEFPDDTPRRCLSSRHRHDWEDLRHGSPGRLSPHAHATPGVDLLKPGLAKQGLEVSSCLIVKQNRGDAPSLEPFREWTWARHVLATHREQVLVVITFVYGDSPNPDIVDRQTEREVGGLLPAHRRSSARSGRLFRSVAGHGGKSPP